MDFVPKFLQLKGFQEKSFEKLFKNKYKNAQKNNTFQTKPNVVYKIRLTMLTVK